VVDVLHCISTTVYLLFLSVNLKSNSCLITFVYILPNIAITMCWNMNKNQGQWFVKSESIVKSVKSHGEGGGERERRAFLGGDLWLLVQISLLFLMRHFPFYSLKYPTKYMSKFIGTVQIILKSNWQKNKGHLYVTAGEVNVEWNPEDAVHVFNKTQTFYSMNGLKRIYNQIENDKKMKRDLKAIFSLEFMNYAQGMSYFFPHFSLDGWI
jgi:hypothetical protein